ncbi:polysaccharide pyruvyl transferase family protein [Serinicoccus sediminis]|uniref:polysaccharide pyruvyl transferase family protein n=1 Tax=Serinicoccus sediminis TaxID=2306021 RepID=UPI001021FD6D|nr:polysaccharide pyruvyl transferase family protein [Serinicoccus sediminis]
MARPPRLRDLARAARAVRRRGRTRPATGPRPTATLVALRRGPSGDLRLDITVDTVTAGGRAIGELRLRDGLDLVPFALARADRTDRGALLVGHLDPQTLEQLPEGTYDVSVTLLAPGAGRRLARVAVATDAPLATLPLVEPYATAHGNLSLRRRRGRVLDPGAVGQVAAVTDARSADPALAAALPDLAARLRTALGATDVGYHLPTPSTARFDHLVPGLGVSIDVSVGDGAWQVTARPRERTSARFLRNTLVGAARMVRQEGTEVHHVTAAGGAVPVATPAADALLADRLLALVDRFRSFLDAGPRPEEHGFVPAQWWDAKPNFGDVLGPLLVQELTGRPAINVRSFPSEDPGLFTVGSIAAHLDRPGARIWGSGLIGTLSTAKAQHLADRRPRSIHAVRGERTRAALRDELGWEVPEVYGDPALLLPRFYTPRPSSRTAGRIALVPHYMHLDLLPDLPDEVAVVDVRQGPEEVVDQIVGARACVSSSLHGLVLAQAYGVPWTWLRVGEKTLHGDTFKFEDFFTTLDRDAVPFLDVSAEELASTSWSAVAGGSRVPASRFDAERLLAAFPEV